MKKKEIIFVLLILGIALLIWLGSKIFTKDSNRESSNSQDMLEITVDGELYGSYPLNQDQDIKINDSNVCRIKNGQVTMIEADCPDQLCVKMNALTGPGGNIVCLPNKVILKIVSEKVSSDQPDTIAS